MLDKLVNPKKLDKGPFLWKVSLCSRSRSFMFFSLLFPPPPLAKSVPDTEVRTFPALD